MPRLTTALRDGLRNLDGRTRTAVVALVATPDGPEPVGIARLAGSGSGRAEGAVAVVDAWQRRGIGRRLITAITSVAAAEPTITHEDVLADLLSR